MKYAWLIVAILLVTIAVIWWRRPVLPQTQLRLLVLEEDGRPVVGAKTGAAFEILGGDNRAIRETYTGEDGLAVFTSKSTGSVSFGATKKGYYPSRWGYKFTSSLGGMWQPWNKEIRVVLRRVVNPVPMYARSTQTINLSLPEKGKEIGFDLMECNWISPYGSGKRADFVFFQGSAADGTPVLRITFPNRWDGIQISRNEFPYSDFYFDRHAPLAGYQPELAIKYSKLINDDQNVGYYFRVRSSEDGGRLARGMYGKIRGEIRFDINARGTASIAMDYYLNPDYSTNLEFDPGRNLVVGANSYELLTAP